MPRTTHVAAPSKIDQLLTLTGQVVEQNTQLKAELALLKAGQEAQGSKLSAVQAAQVEERKKRKEQEEHEVRNRASSSKAKFDKREDSSKRLKKAQKKGDVLHLGSFDDESDKVLSDAVRNNQKFLSEKGWPDFLKLIIDELRLSGSDETINCIMDSPYLKEWGLRASMHPRTASKSPPLSQSPPACMCQSRSTTVTLQPQSSSLPKRR